MGGSSYSPGPGFGELVNRLANPPNPMQTMGATVNALTAAKNFQAQQASADAYKQSVDPTTGEVDLGKYKALMSQGPGAFNFGPLVQQGGQAVGAVGQGTTADVQSKLAQLDAAGNLMEPLYKQAIGTGYVNPADAQALVDQAKSMGFVTPQQYQAWSTTLKNSQNAAGFVIGANTGNEAARTLVLGRPGMADVGPTIQPYQPVPGALPSAAPPLQKGISPDTGAGLVTVLLPNNQSIQVTLGQAQSILQNNPELARLNPNLGQGQSGGGTGHYPAPAAPAPAAPGGGTPAPAAPPAQGGGAPAPQPPPPGEQRNVNAPAYSQPPGPAPAEAGGVGVPPAKGYQENTIEPSQKAATALVTTAKDTPNVSALINDMRSQVNQPGWNPGLGAQAGSTWRQVLDRVGVNATGTAPDQQKMAQASYDEFAKDANLIASRQLATIGNPSDARQNLAEAITPGMAQTKEGVLGISSTLLGNQDAINRTAASWAQAKSQGWTDGRHNEWLNQRWNATDQVSGGRFDPRVFWLADTPGTGDDQWRRMASKIPKDQQAQFAKNVQYAKDQGWINQPAGPGTALAVVNP